MLEYKLEYAENTFLNGLYRWDKFLHSVSRICTKMLGIKYTAFETCPEKIALNIETQVVEAALISPDAPKQADVSFASGISFHANDYRFGGWSGFDIDSQGKIVAVSDEGFALKASPKLNSMGHIVGFDDAIFSSLRDQNGAVLQGKNATDAEEITLLSNGQLAVSFERDHRILIFNDILEPAVDSIALPQDMLDAFEQFTQAFKETGHRQYGNVGLEAMTVLENGRLMTVIEEPLPNEQEHRVYMQNDMGGWDNLYYQGQAGFGISGATTLPNGNVLFLERSTEYFSSYEHYGVRVVELNKNDFFAGNHIVGKTWLEFEPTTGENFESIFCYAGKDGATYIGLATDDNYAYSERNLLLNFEWTPQSTEPAPLDLQPPIAFSHF